MMIAPSAARLDSGEDFVIFSSAASRDVTCTDFVTSTTKDRNEDQLLLTIVTSVGRGFLLLAETSWRKL